MSFSQIKQRFNYFWNLHLLSFYDFLFLHGLDEYNNLSIYTKPQFLKNKTHAQIITCLQIWHILHSSTMAIL